MSGDVITAQIPDKSNSGKRAKPSRVNGVLVTTSTIFEVVVAARLLIGTAMI